MSDAPRDWRVVGDRGPRIIHLLRQKRAANVVNGYVRLGASGFTMSAGGFYATDRFGSSDPQFRTVAAGGGKICGVKSMAEGSIFLFAPDGGERLLIDIAEDDRSVGLLLAVSEIGSFRHRQVSEDARRHVAVGGHEKRAVHVFSALDAPAVRRRDLIVHLRAELGAGGGDFVQIPA